MIGKAASNAGNAARNRIGLKVVPMALLLALAAPPAWAQTLNFATGDSSDPIEIYADDGIEWQQEKMLFTATGNARAVRGDVEIQAHVLRAYYREIEGGGTEIWRIDADRDVRITSPGETVVGEKGVYDVDNGILVVSGSHVKLVTAEDEITADRQLEYWEKKQMAVARGNAFAVRGDRRLRADILTVYFSPDERGRSRVHRVEAFDNVYIVTDKDTVIADRGVYNVLSGIATLTGSVKITRGQTQLNGCTAVVDLNTGISRLKGCATEGIGGRQVQGLVQPKIVNRLNTN